MNNRQFGPCLANYGTRFRLWAPAAKRVDVMLEQPHAMKRGEDGWFTADIAGVKAGARYKFRIDDEIDVPDPASAFQPDDVFGPGEVIDHKAFGWRATDWRPRSAWLRRPRTNNGWWRRSAIRPATAGFRTSN